MNIRLKRSRPFLYVQIIFIIFSVLGMGDEPVKPSNLECREYNTLSDPTRNINHDGPAVDEEFYCDKTASPFSLTSPDWVDAGWYRFAGPGGHRMPEKSPGLSKCGGYVTGWLEGTHPRGVGQTIETRVCFHYDRMDCYHSAEAKVTNCGEYFVYYLPNYPKNCPSRYCATHESLPDA